MKYFIDTEFIARDSGAIDLISIGIVAEDGSDFYRENVYATALGDISDWVRANVFPHLEITKLFPNDALIGTPGEIAHDIQNFISDDSPELWGYYCAYDYVLLSQLMGGMERWPAGWPYLMYDLRQWLDARGLQRVKQDDDAPHDALQDARWIYETFMAYQPRGGPAQININEQHWPPAIR